jgi:hypothetical protein
VEQKLPRSNLFNSIAYLHLLCTASYLTSLLGCMGLFTQLLASYLGFQGTPGASSTPATEPEAVAALEALGKYLDRLDEAVRRMTKLEGLVEGGLASVQGDVRWLGRKLDNLFRLIESNNSTGSIADALRSKDFGHKYSLQELMAATEVCSCIAFHQACLSALELALHSYGWLRRTTGFSFR